MAPKSNPPTNWRTSSKLWVPESSRLLACLLIVFTLQILFFSTPASSIYENDLSTPASSIQDHDLTTNTSFRGMIKLGEGFVKNPEDASIDSNGVLYTATRDGVIKRMYKNGTWNDWQKTDSQNLLGITTTRKKNELLVCDSEQGLLKVTDEGVSVLVSQFNGSQIRFANDVVEASDGIIYFTVSSTKYTPAEYYLDLIEGEPHGQLLKYNPSTNETTLELDGLYFANGVALTKDENYVIVCESWKFRCIKHRLRVSLRKDREIFIDNLPGGPDNINIDPDGFSHWISLITMNASGIEALQSCKESQTLLEAYPGLIPLIIPMDNGAPATVVNVKGGEIIREVSDPNATYISFVTSTVGFEDYIFVASIHADFIGKLQLPVA